MNISFSFNDLLAVPGEISGGCNKETSVLPSEFMECGMLTDSTAQAVCDHNCSWISFTAKRSWTILVNFFCDEVRIADWDVFKDNVSKLLKLLPPPDFLIPSNFTS